MKKFLVFLLLVALVGGAGFLLYDPHLKPYLGPVFEKAGLIGDGSERIVKNGVNEKGKGKAVEAQKLPGPAPDKGKAAPTKAATPKETAKTEPPKSEIDKLVEARYPLPNVLPLEQIVNNWNNVPQRAYPKTVALKEKVGFKMIIAGNEATSTVAPGTEVQPALLTGTNLKIVSLANRAMSTTVHVDKTDFKERITGKYNEFVSYHTKLALDRRAKAKKKLEETPDKVAQIAANAGKWDDTGDPRFHPVKASLANGEVSNVSLEEATSFRWNGRESISGEIKGTYDTVSVHFEVATIFGRFPADYKCLLNGGRVVGWIDPISEEKL